MNLSHIRLKKYFAKKQKGEDASSEADLDVDRKQAVVHDHISFLMKSMETDERAAEDAQVHTVTCLSKFIEKIRVKRFLAKRAKETKFKKLKAIIRELYDGKLETPELDEMIEKVRQDNIKREKLLKEIESEL